MQSSIYLVFALVAFTAAKQLDVGPQLFSEPQASSSTQKPGKRYATEEYSEETQPDKENSFKKPNEDEQLQKWYNQFLPEVPQLEIRGLSALQDNTYVQKQKSDPEIEQRNYQYINLYTEEKSKEQANNKYFSEVKKNEPYVNFYWQNKQQDRVQQESDLQGDSKWNTYISEVTKDEPLEKYYWVKEQDKIQQESDLQKDSQWKTYVTKDRPYEKFYWQKEDDTNQQQSDLQKESPWKTYSSEPVPKQENILLNEQLKQQWNRILDHNRKQLKSLSPAAKEEQNSQRIKQNEKPSESKQSSKTEIEKEIELILKNYGVFESGKQSPIIQAQAINQRPPIVIQKEVSITKHLPVHIVKKVKVSVPKPVLVPIPEAYEVKVPHPYPVPVPIVKHIPVSVIKAH